MNYVQPFIYSFEERGGNEIIENREMREMGNFDAEDFICSFCETGALNYVGLFIYVKSVDFWLYL